MAESPGMKQTGLGHIAAWYSYQKYKFLLKWFYLLTGRIFKSETRLWVNSTHKPDFITRLTFSKLNRLDRTILKDSVLNKLSHCYRYWSFFQPDYILLIFIQLPNLEKGHIAEWQASNWTVWMVEHVHVWRAFGSSHK